MDFATWRCSRATCLYAHCLDELSLPKDGYPSNSDAPRVHPTKNGWVWLSDLWRIYFHWEFGRGITHTSDARSIMNTMFGESLYESAITRPKHLDWPVAWHVAMRLYLAQPRSRRLPTGFLPRMVTYLEFQNGQRGTVGDCGFGVSNTVFGARAPVPRRASDSARAVYVVPVPALPSEAGVRSVSSVTVPEPASASAPVGAGGAPLVLGPPWVGADSPMEEHEVSPVSDSGSEVIFGAL